MLLYTIIVIDDLRVCETAAVEFALMTDRRGA
jgi:hypothetical protein